MAMPLPVASRRLIPTCISAMLVFVPLALHGCGGGGGGATTTTTTTTSTTTTTTTTTPFIAPGQCTDEQRLSRCADGFCNETFCRCIPNYASGSSSSSACDLPAKQRQVTFYMYRAQDNNDHDWANDDVASLSGVMWYLHNEVVVQSCPRKFNVTRIIRMKVTMRNTDKMFDVRKSMFGPLAIFDNGACKNCMGNFEQYGYAVGCEYPSGGDVYAYDGYHPVWYSLPGRCPSQPFANKSFICSYFEQLGGECAYPDGRDTCTFAYEESGSIDVEELYSAGFDYSKFCANRDALEYDRRTDSGSDDLEFWNQKQDVQRNARRVEALKGLFLRNYPELPDLPEPWCDWQEPAGPTADRGELDHAQVEEHSGVVV